MKRNLSNFLILNLFLLFFLNLAHAQNNQYADIVANKLMKIATSDKPITKNDYDDFWNSTGIKSRDQKISLIAKLKDNYGIIQQYNNILWQCSERSWIDAKIIDCQKINSNYQNIRNQLFKLLGDEEFKKIDDNFNNIINISAKRGGKISNTSSDQPITLDKIQYAKKLSQLMLERVEKILQIDYR
jgi:hypothetical protein